LTRAIHLNGDRGGTQWAGASIQSCPGRAYAVCRQSSKGPPLSPYCCQLCGKTGGEAPTSAGSCRYP
jgi:hypothetical protein